MNAASSKAFVSAHFFLSTLVLGVAAGSDWNKVATKSQRKNEVEQHLLICNAYASPVSLDIYHSEPSSDINSSNAYASPVDRITGSRPVAYKECREFEIPLEEGDQLDFKEGKVNVGTFYATSLPTSTTSLLLVPQRRDSQSKSMRFESHAFANLQSPQIAVVDAYKGNGQTDVSIGEVLPAGSTSEPVVEMLKFSSVVAVNRGNYKIASTGSLGQPLVPVAKVLLAQDKAKYVVMRVGFESVSGSIASYPQELVVFSRSGALRLGLGVSNILLCALATFFTNVL